MSDRLLNGYPSKQGPLITDGTKPFKKGWEWDPQTNDGHRHEWEVVMLAPPGHHRLEEVVRCSVCRCPRCGTVYQPNPCLLRRHHRIDHEYANGGKEKVGGMSLIRGNALTIPLADNTAETDG